MNANFASNNKFVVAMIAALGLIAMSNPVRADSRFEAINVQGSLTVDCASRQMPTQQQVADLVGVTNASQVYGLRLRLRTDVNRACHSGVDLVQIVRTKSAGQEDLVAVAQVD